MLGSTATCSIVREFGRRLIENQQTNAATTTKLDRAMATHSFADTARNIHSAFVCVFQNPLWLVAAESILLDTMG